MLDIVMKAWNKITAFSLLTLILLTIFANVFLVHMQNEAVPNNPLVEINRIYNELQAGKDIQDVSMKGIQISKIEKADISLNVYMNRSKERVILLPADEEMFYQFQYEITHISTTIVWLINLFFAISIIVICYVNYYIRKQIIKPFHELEYIADALRNRDFTYELPQQKYKYFGKFIWAIDVMKEELQYHEEKELQLMKDKKTMIASISHDIKTPLSNIRLYTDTLQTSIYPTSTIQQRLYENCDKIDQYIKDIQNTNNENLFDFEVNMQEVYLHDITHILKQEEERVQLAMVDYQQDSCKDKLVYTDLYRLKEVINNVVDNAIKYGDGKWIHVSFYEEDHHQIITIKNSGDAIEAKDNNAIFQSFYRGNNVKNQKGNGLGLYICKQLMKKMDGDIFLSQDEGSVCFHIVLGVL